jgi:hypothetical protein
MIQKVLIRVGISLMLTACGAQNSNVGQEALIGVENPPGVENPVVIAPDKTETPNDNVQMTSPAANSRISVAGAFRLSASIEHPAGINDVEFILGEFDRFYLKLGLNGVPSLQINEMVDLKKCMAITVTPGRKPIRAIIYPKTGPKIEVSLGTIDLYR